MRYAADRASLASSVGAAQPRSRAILDSLLRCPRSCRMTMVFERLRQWHSHAASMTSVISARNFPERWASRPRRHLTFESENTLGIGLHQHLLMFGRDVEAIVRGDLIGGLLIRVIHRVDHTVGAEHV